MSANGEYSMADEVIKKLGAQIADLVVQLTIKDAQIEMLQRASVGAQPPQEQDTNHEARSPSGQ